MHVDIASACGTQAATRSQHNVRVVKVFHTLCATFSAGYEHGE